MDRSLAQKGIIELVTRFETHFDSYKDQNYKEARLRGEFINPFFENLGWDVYNKNNSAEAYREVIQEDTLKIEETLKAPDYSFRLAGGKRLFFVEAKKPSVSVLESIQPAYQVRRYGWSAKHPISVVTDFEEFAIYDCTAKPHPNDKPSVARIKYLTFQDYLREFDFIWDTFSREQVLRGSFDKFVHSDKQKQGTTTVDKDFLESLDRWRTYLAVNISWNNKLLGEDEINFAVQQLIDRIIFLRIAEDRKIEPYGSLKNALSYGDYYSNLLLQFKRADEKYNSGLFDFKRDRLSETLKIENKVLKTIIDELYYPKSPYEFSVLPIEILGSVYEQFLGKVIRITPAHHAKVEEKPEVRKAGGVYYTPQYIVDYIVKQTVGKLIEGKTPKEISSITIVDPACGSGSFLIGTLQYLFEYHRNYYNSNKIQSKNKKDSPLTPDGHLSTSEKKRILLNNIYGVDLDANAVEVTKLSLLLKCLEGETDASINQQLNLFNERVLPSLDRNIKNGNSLIDVDFYDNQIDFGEEKKAKPFNWQKAFPNVFENNGFDVVIGNPPYVMSDIDNTQKTYLSKKYSFQQGKPDLYRFFMEIGHKILKDGGFFSFIIPNSILTIPSCVKLRHYLITQVGITEIVNFHGRVFLDASVNSIILSTQKGFISPAIKVYNDIENRPNSVSLNKALSSPVQLTVDEILQTDDYKILVNQNTNVTGVIRKIEKSSIKLYELSDYTLGMQVYHNSIHSKTEIANRIYHSKYKENETYYPESGGTNIKKYFFISDFKEYVSYGNWCYNKPDWKYCSEERILIREIPNKEGLTCCLTDEISISSKAIIVLIGKKIDNKYLLGLLNSKLIGFYIFNSTEKGTQRLFPRVSLTSIRNLPIRISLDQEVMNSIVKNVAMLNSLNQELRKTKLSRDGEQIQSHIGHCENRINEMVYNLYALTDEEIRIIESSFK